jgi:hypothetical protein
MLSTVSTDVIRMQGVILDATGNLYGTAGRRGVHRFGLVFEIAPQQVFKTLFGGDKQLEHCFLLGESLLVMTTKSGPSSPYALQKLRVVVETSQLHSLTVCPILDHQNCRS